MGSDPADRTVFATWVHSARQRWSARLLIDSIHSFGGALGRCPVWLFEANPQRVSCAGLASERVRVLPLDAPEAVRRYILGEKVFACARAEALAGPETRSLVWLSPECLIVRPPLLFDLAGSFDAAVRPVHIRNIGLPVTAPVDAFWSRVYEAVGVPDVQATVESFVDAQRIRAYFNSAAFALDPATRLFRRWLDLFEQLIDDRAFQAGPCQDELHQIFLHQAILSTLVATALDPARVRTLPPDYGYPYNLHVDVPPERRAQTLDELTCAIYEERPVDPERMDDIRVEEPLRSWLGRYTETYPG